MNRKKIVAEGLAVLAVLFLLSVPSALAEPCNGDFDCDGDVDVVDFMTFMADFMRGFMGINPCEPCRYIDIPKTGQTTICSDNSGTTIECTGTGQDGEYQRGFAWPEPRFTDHEDGTATDKFTGFMWTRDANLPGGSKNWQEALDYVAAMNAGTYENFGYTDWSLPNVRELHSLIDFGEHEPALTSGHPFINVQPEWITYFWSSTTYGPESYRDYAWRVCLTFGVVHIDPKTTTWYVWPVRGVH